jgi:hypothetical protein
MGTITQEKSLALQAEIGTSRRIVLQGAGAGKPCRSTVYPVGSVGRFTESGAASAGPVGKAASLKLALNQLIAAEISAFALSLGLVQRAGVSIDTFMAILWESALFAPAFEKKLPQLPPRTISIRTLPHVSS